jgi:hypothetical protein
MTGSHKDYKAQKRAQAEAKKLSNERRWAISGKTKAEIAKVPLTPAEEFKALWVLMRADTNGVYQKVRKAPIVAYILATIITVIHPPAFVYVFGLAIAVHLVSLCMYPHYFVTRRSMKDVAAASEMPNPEYDRKGRRLRDRPMGIPQNRSTEEILNDWDRDRRYGLDPRQY